MKKLLAITSEKKQLTESIVECGDPMGQAMSSSMPVQPPVTMTVNATASGIDQIKQLLSLMNNAEATRSSPAALLPQGGSVGIEMPSKTLALDDIDPENEEYANSPDEKYSDISASIPSGDDLHRKKKMYAKAQDGDNAMAVESKIRSDLMRLYAEIKEGKR